MDARHRSFFALSKLLFLYCSVFERYGRPQLPWAFMYYRGAMHTVRLELNVAMSYGHLSHLIREVDTISLQCNIWLPNEFEECWRQFSKVAQAAKQRKLQEVDWTEFPVGLTSDDIN